MELVKSTIIREQTSIQLSSCPFVPVQAVDLHVLFFKCEAVRSTRKWLRSVSGIRKSALGSTFGVCAGYAPTAFLGPICAVVP